MHTKEECAVRIDYDKAVTMGAMLYDVLSSQGVDDEYVDKTLSLYLHLILKAFPEKIDCVTIADDVVKRYNEVNGDGEAILLLEDVEGLLN